MQIKISNTLTTLIEQTLAGNRVQTFVFGLVNEGNVALNAFELQFQVQKGGEWYTYYNQGTDWTDAPEESAIRISTVNPVTLAAGEKGSFVIDFIKGFYALRLQASVASNETTLKLEVGGE